MESYLPELLATLEPQKKLLFALERRIELIYLDIDSKSEYEQNEAEITVIKTQGEIETLKKVISEKTEYFEKYAKKFDVEYNEMMSKYDTLYKNARLAMMKKPKLRELIENAKIKEIENNKEAKLFFYKKMKELIQ